MGNYSGNGKYKNEETNTADKAIEHQNDLREKQYAFELAKSREFLNWYAGFYFCALTLTLTRRHRFKPYVLPITMPLTFIFGYYIDLAYGSKYRRILDEAGDILKYESELISICNKDTETGKCLREERMRYHTVLLPL